MKLRWIRVDASALIALVLLLIVIAALWSGYDVINGGYSQADIPIAF